MRRFDLSVGASMALVGLIAIGFAALRSTSLVWASLTFTSTLILLSTALLGTIARRGCSRLPWLGFTVFGWVYLVSAFWLWPAKNGADAPPLLPILLLDAFLPEQDTNAVQKVGVYLWDLSEPRESDKLFIMQGTPFTGRVVHVLNFRRIGHSLAAIVFGALGALIGCGFAACEQWNKPPIPPKTALLPQPE